jgi:hypothetical protein
LTRSRNTQFLTVTFPQKFAQSPLDPGRPPVMVKPSMTVPSDGRLRANTTSENPLPWPSMSIAVTEGPPSERRTTPSGRYAAELMGDPAITLSS